MRDRSGYIMMRWVGGLYHLGIAFVFSCCLAMLPAYGAALTLAQQPQILIILDNSQGMAGNLQGAIMSGSGTVPANAGPLAPTASPPLAWPSPVCYPVSSYSPRSNLGPSNGATCPAGTAPYTVSIGNGTLQDNSESMINIAEQSLLAQFNNPSNSNAFQVGLMDFATANAPTLYDTWVYYMSDNNTLNANGSVSTYGSFSYGSSAASPSAADPVAAYNPCYLVTTGACKNIEGVLGGALSSAPYLYMAATSDDPEINDVLYASPGLPENILTYGGPNPDPPNYTLTQYENQVVGSAPLWETYNHSTGGVRATAPTSAGYAPYSGQVWYAERGLAYDAPPVTSAALSSSSWGQADLLAQVQPFSLNLSSFNQMLAPEQFPAGMSIVADSEYAPVAGTLQSALAYLSSSQGPISGPTPACAPKYVILITDGQPTMGTSGHVYPPLGSAAATLYGETPSNDNAVNEALQAVKNLYNNNSANGAGSIKTYVLGIGPNINCPPSAAAAGACSAEAAAGYQVLEELATAGQGGTTTSPILPYSAQTPAQFQQAFAAILNSIEQQVLTSNSGSNSNLTVNNLQYVLTSTATLGEGNMAAYPVLSNGFASTVASWDVDSLMANNLTLRASNLFSTGAPSASGTLGAITGIMNMDAAAFGTLPAGLTVGDIENYTVDPNYQGGQYLGGRQPSWYVGLTSPIAPIVVGPPDNANLLSSTGYVGFAQQQMSRESLAIFGDNDGFLYAVDANTGTLVWGWMPRPLVQELQNYSTFWHGANMSNGMREVDAQDTSGNWWSYLVGIGGNGAIQYGLQLNAPGTTGTAQAQLYQEAWEVDTTGATEPNPQLPAVMRPVPSSGTAYLATVLNVTSGSTVSAVLDVTNIGAGTTTPYTLPFPATTQPYVDQNGNIFIGDGGANVWEATAFTSAGHPSPFAAASTWTPLNNSSANPTGINFGNSATSSDGASALTSVSGAYYNGIEYLVLESASRVTVLVDESNGWQPLWTSDVGNGESFDATTGAYVSNAGIAPLPPGTVISNPALVAEGAVILPVSVPPASTSTNVCAEPTAWLYFYTLFDGTFPNYTFQDMSGNYITGPIQVGFGVAYTPSLALFDGQLRLQTAAAQNPNTSGGASGSGASGASGSGSGAPCAQCLGPSYNGAGPGPQGPAGWRELPLS